MTSEKVVLEKRLPIRIISELPVKNAVRITVRRTLLLRALHAKEVTLYAVRGKITFFLRSSEALPFMPEHGKTARRPRFSETVSGAFIDERALGGAAVFAAVLRRIGTIFGGSYYDNVIRAFFTAADSASQALAIVHIAVPRIAAAAAVFALAAWLFAFLKKLCALSRFSLSRGKNHIFVKSGLITLYEHALVPDSAVISCETVTTMLTGRPPLYLRGVMIYPAAGSESRENILRRYFGLSLENVPRVKSPARAIFGHCAAPLWAAGICAALLIIARYLPTLRYAELLRTALYAGTAVGVYRAVLAAIFAARAKSAFGKTAVMVSRRRGTRLFSACFAVSEIRSETVRRFFFSDLRDITIATADGSKHKGKRLLEVRG